MKMILASLGKLRKRRKEFGHVWPSFLQLLRRDGRYPERLRFVQAGPVHDRSIPAGGKRKKRIDRLGQTPISHWLKRGGTMKGVGMVRGVLVSLAVVGFCFPQPLSAAGAVPDQRPVVIDVALMDGGVLLGQVVDPQGASLKGVPVSLRDRDREVAAAKTNDGGFFAVRGLRGGVYQIVAAEGHGAYRLWTPGTAPPSSQQGALVVAGRQTVRGQFGGGALRFWLANPWVIAGIVATAVAVPVAIHNAQRPSSP